MCWDRGPCHIQYNWDYKFNLNLQVDSSSLWEIKHYFVQRKTSNLYYSIWYFLPAAFRAQTAPSSAFLLPLTYVLAPAAA